MIFVDLAGLHPPDDWLERAAAITAQLEAAGSPEERAEIIDDNQPLWTELKDWLSQHNFDKCWFSEARDCFSHKQIEHFRPKKSARDLDGNDREGYWWLAFDWRNFRICGGVGNAKKGAYFPVRVGTNPATSANRNTDDEIYLLLDPTVLADTLMLSFTEGGRAVPAPECEDWGKLRVEKSIERYKLNDHPPLSRARSGVWNLCRVKIDEIQVLMMECQRNQTAAKMTKLNSKLEELRSMTHPRAEFSAVATACIQQAQKTWLTKLLQAPVNPNNN